jgi:hypothetical protein
MAAAIKERRRGDAGEARKQTRAASTRPAGAKQHEHTTNGDGARGRGRDHLIKVSLNLPEEEFEALKDLADRRQTSATQVVRESLRTELYIQGLVDSGAVIIAKLGRRAREIVFSQMNSVGAGLTRGGL